MSQAQTLQDIYTKIADIYDKFCNLSLDDVTYLQTNVTISTTSFAASQLSFYNPSGKQSISDAQTEVNHLIAATFAIARDERLATDEVYMSASGDIVPIPKGSPLDLLPNLLKALLLFSAPLKVILNIILNIIADVLYEYLKRKLSEKNAGRGTCIYFSTSRILDIPKKATHLLIELTGFPDYISKRFDEDIDKSLIKGENQANPNLSKYTGKGLCTLSFGVGLSNEVLVKNVYWDDDRTIRYEKEIIEIPTYEYSNLDKYAYVYLNENMLVGVCYLA